MTPLGALFSLSQGEAHARAYWLLQMRLAQLSLMSLFLGGWDMDYLLIPTLGPLQCPCGSVAM